MKKTKRYAIASLTLATALVLSPSAFAEEEVASEQEETTVEEVATEDEASEEVPTANEEDEDETEAEEELTEPLYADVSDDHFAYHAIIYLTERGFVSGSADGYFQPDTALTRAQAAKILSETLGLTVSSSYKLKATDVPATHWAVDYFKALEKEGIMTGSNGELKPGALVTRGQMATMLNRAFDYAAPTKFTSFTDVDRSFWAYRDINILATNGVTTQANQAFRPNQPTTRAQFSLFVARSLDDRFKSYTSQK